MTGKNHVSYDMIVISVVMLMFFFGVLEEMSCRLEIWPKYNIEVRDNPRFTSWICKAELSLNPHC